VNDNNPLLSEWKTPFGIAPFVEISDEHFLPAYETAMAEHRANVNAIAEASEPATFANTIEALERADRLLQRLDAVFWNLAAADTNDARQAIERELAPKLTRHHLSVTLNDRLFQKVAALHESRHSLGLTGEQELLLENYYKSFVRAGAKLDDSGKSRITEIGARLAELYTAFSQNVLKDEKTFQLILEEGDLQGLPDFVREAAANAAAERGFPGKYAITLARSSIEPFLQFSARRDLREQAYKAYVSRGMMSAETDNRAIIREILDLRTERARLLGFENFAQFSLDNKMARTPNAVKRLLEDVWHPARKRAQEEFAALEALAQQEGENDSLAAWDWHYWAERRRQAEFDLDEATLKPYFQLDRVIAAAFHTAERLFGLTFTLRDDVPVYHPDVRVWEVKHKDGLTVGLFLGDYFHRSSKRSGAWMSAFRSQEKLDGAVTPIIVNVMNFSKSGEGKPSLLSIDDAETLFHEFGHGMHGLLSNVTYPSLSGTSVDRDFVELPSQLYENWLLQPETLSRFATHAETGEPMPKALIDRVLAARKFNQGFATVEYTASALLDLAVHEEGLNGADDIEAYEQKLRKEIGAPEAIALRHRPTHFQHVFAGEGYASGYYTYLWAEVMEADGFKAFEETGDVFAPEVAERLHKFVYSSGGTMRPEEAYRAFRGRDAEVGPLLEKRGLA
jgi:peptidyl-dipeptidase Dcp